MLLSGANGGVAQKDWQVRNEDDFIELQPWGVPCDNSWMKDHVNQWTGYSFYTWEMAIEKCITVSYSLSMQPVLAFVGGLKFNILPAPLADIETMVCYPDKQPGGVDLSVLRTVINSGGVMLFSRTIRLVERFGSNTDFVNGNTYSAYETYRNPTGVAVGNHGVEDDRSLEVRWDFLRFYLQLTGGCWECNLSDIIYIYIYICSIYILSMGCGVIHHRLDVCCYALCPQ